MAVSQVSAALNLSINDACRLGASKSLAIPRLCASSFAPMAASFLQGTPLAIRTSYPQSIRKLRARAASIRCEQSANEGNSLDVWLGRLAMVGFAVAISVEIATGKGLLENFGVTTPLPTVALAVTGLVGVLTAIFIFQSASKN